MALYFQQIDDIQSSHSKKQICTIQTGIATIGSCLGKNNQESRLSKLSVGTLFLVLVYNFNLVYQASVCRNSTKL